MYQHRDKLTNNGHYTVVLVGTLPMVDIFALAREIFEAFWADSATNVLFLTSDEERTTLYTYTAYSNESCGTPQTVAHNYYWHMNQGGNKEVPGSTALEDKKESKKKESPRIGFEFNRPFFPHKCSNLFNCPIRVATFPFPPFMHLSQRPRKDNENITETYFDGIEGIVVRVLSQRLHFTPILVLPEDEERWGSCNDQQENCTGALKLVGYFDQ